MYKKPYYYPFSLDFEKLITEYPPFEDYMETVHKWSRDKIEEIKFKRIQSAVKRAWEVPFYIERWKKAGIESPDDIQSMEDFEKIPPFTIDDLRNSYIENPPFGNFQGVDIKDGYNQPLVLHTSGGTTGMPRPMLFSAQDREVGAMVHSRTFALQGIKPGNLIQITYGFSTVNAGFLNRESIWKYTGSVPLTTGTGLATPTKMQVKLAKEWKTSVLMGFPDYIRQFGRTALDMGIDPKKDLSITHILTHLGPEKRDDLEELFGADVYDSYGSHEGVGHSAAECTHKNGRHIFEDAFNLEILNPETYEVLPHGEKGTIVVTAMSKYAAPIIRYNVNDVSSILPGKCTCGSETLRLDAMFGRADSAVKLRGVNVFPESIGVLLSDDNRTTKEYFCVVEKEIVNSVPKDKLTIMIELVNDNINTLNFEVDLKEKVKVHLGLSAEISFVKEGELYNLTTTKHQSGKKIRITDKR